MGQLGRGEEVGCGGNERDKGGELILCVCKLENLVRSRLGFGVNRKVSGDRREDAAWDSLLFVVIDTDQTVDIDESTGVDLSSLGRRDGADCERVIEEDEDVGKETEGEQADGKSTRGTERTGDRVEVQLLGASVRIGDGKHLRPSAPGWSFDSPIGLLLEYGEETSLPRQTPRTASSAKGIGKGGRGSCGGICVPHCWETRWAWASASGRRAQSDPQRWWGGPPLSSSFESLGRIGVRDSGDEGFIADMQRKVDAPECP